MTVAAHDKWDDSQDTLTDVVQVLMAQRRMSQAELGRVIGVGPNTVSLKLSGKRRWRFDDLDDLARYFGVRPADLLVDPVHALQAVLSVTRKYLRHATLRSVVLADAA